MGMAQKIALAACMLFGLGPAAWADDAAPIVQPYSENPHYLAWNNTPIIALGATGYHSWTPISRPETLDFEQQLGRLARVIEEIDSPHIHGFVRCLPYDPMNHLHDGEVERVLQPWVKTADGRYDLTQFSAEWEERLRAYLQTAFDHQLVVSLEVWDDWSITRGPNGAYNPEGAAWNAHPFNPQNNINYDANVLPASTSRCNAPFYRTIPSREHNQTVLALQKHYVKHLLSIAGDYPNIIINIANESRAHLDWSRFWAAYIDAQQSVDRMIGEMPSTNRQDGGGECEHALNPFTLATDPGYDFVDIAQAVSGHEFQSPFEQAFKGGRRILQYRHAMAEAGTQRPLLTSKDYTRSSNGGTLVFWGRIMGGLSAARFHRLAGDHPASVSDFQHETVARVGRFFADIPFWRMQPKPDLAAPLPEGAGVNALVEAGQRAVVQVAGAAEHPTPSTLHLNIAPGNWAVRMIDPQTGEELRQFTAPAKEDGLQLTIDEEINHVVLDLERQS